jgi:GNAT superfamily N-acetyltransferase
MRLPILTARPDLTSQDLVRLFHRTAMRWGDLVAETTQLSCGTALHCAELAGVADANHMRDAALAPGQSASEAMEEVRAHFEQVGTRCGFWVMNPSEPTERTQPLVEHLLAGGWRARETSIMHIHRAANLPGPAAGTQIISARASFRLARELVAQAVAERISGTAVAAEKGPESLLVESDMRRLDDSHWDALLALENGVPVAQVGVLSVGDMGRIDGLFVAPAHRRRGLAMMMMGQALQSCARSIFRHVFMEIDPQNPPSVRVAGGCGFSAVGQAVAYFASP